jgi:hypothetical protein
VEGLRDFWVPAALKSLQLTHPLLNTVPAAQLSPNRSPTHSHSTFSITSHTQSCAAPAALASLDVNLLLATHPPTHPLTPHTCSQPSPPLPSFTHPLTRALTHMPTYPHCLLCLQRAGDGDGDVESISETFHEVRKQPPHRSHKRPLAARMHATPALIKQVTACCSTIFNSRLLASHVLTHTRAHTYTRTHTHTPPPTHAHTHTHTHTSLPIAMHAHTRRRGHRSSRQ